MAKVQPQSLRVLFGWTERPFSKSNRGVSAAIIVVCQVKRSKNVLPWLFMCILDPFLYSFSYRRIKLIELFSATFNAIFIVEVRFASKAGYPALH